MTNILHTERGVQTFLHTWGGRRTFLVEVVVVMMIYVDGEKEEDLCLAGARILNRIRKESV